MSGVLNLHTDASVIGERLPKGYVQKRRRHGPTFVAWAGWHSCDFPERPTFAGQAFCGEHGTQRAEFYAVLHGLSASLSYVYTLTFGDRPGVVVMHVDNDPVYKLMVGLHTPNLLRRHHDVARNLCLRHVEAGVDVEWRNVSERHPRHKTVDTMSKLAQRQVLTRPEWRPKDD